MLFLLYKVLHIISAVILLIYLALVSISVSLDSLIYPRLILAAWVTIFIFVFYVSLSFTASQLAYVSFGCFFVKIVLIWGVGSTTFIIDGSLIGFLFVIYH